MFVALFVVACKDASSQSGARYQALQDGELPYQVEVSVNTGNTFPSNRRLLGNNVQWVDRGDELLKPGSTDFSPIMLKKVIELKPTVLRYPGGSLSDLYHWKDGLGEARSRKRSSRFHGDGEDTVLFGTKEFLELCDLTGAEAFLTANVITASVEETLDWIRKVNFERFRNGSGKKLPTVGFLEIGNEPYLIDDNQKKLAISAEQYVKKANALVSKLRKVDSSVKIGIPLRSDDFDGIPATPMPGFNKEVLEGFKGKIDFVALHNTYFPFLWAGVPSNKEQIYLATMAAVAVVKKDLDKTREQLEAYRQRADIPIAITEMNSMFSIGKGETDEYIRTLTGAMYIADLLSLLSKERNILMANFWSLTGNWQFGAIDQKGKERPAYKVLSKFHDMLEGRHVETNVRGPSFDIIKTGAITEQKGNSFLTALGSVSEIKGRGLLKLWVINKHPLKAADVSLNITGEVAIRVVSVETLTTEDYFSVSDAENMTWKKVDGKGSLVVELKPHSVNLITIEL